MDYPHYVKTKNGKFSTRKVRLEPIELKRTERANQYNYQGNFDRPEMPNLYQQQTLTKPGYH